MTSVTEQTQGVMLLRVLMVEDSSRDAALISDTLKHDGLDCTFVRVETAEEFRATISEHVWDIVLADYHLPTFSAPEALRMTRAKSFDLPFVCVSGSIGEETAADLIRAGANDVVLKTHLHRLAIIMRREVVSVEKARALKKEKDAARANLLRQQQIGRTALRDLRRFDLNYREYQLAELLVELSYGWGLKSVIVPKLDVFSSLTGVAKPHVHTNLGNLIEIGVVTVEDTARGPRYTVVSNPDKWRCRLKVSRSAIKDALNTIKAFNGLEDAAPMETPHFFEHLAGAEILKTLVTESETVTEPCWRNLL